MHIALAENKTRWNDFVIRNTRDEFLQSWEWGDFQKSYGRRVWRFVVEHNGERLAQALTVCVSLPGNKSYVYIPRGPAWKPDMNKSRIDSVWSLLTQNWRLIALESNAFFIRIEPAVKVVDTSEDRRKRALDFLLRRRWRAIRPLQPKDTLVIALNNSDEELLGGMRPKTRYNIQLAKKKSLSVRHIDTREGLDLFWKLLNETAVRDTIAFYDFSYYRKLFNILDDISKHPSKRHLLVRLWGVFNKSELLSAALITLFGDTVYYLYGASSNRHRNLMPNYLMHWEIIRWARSKGYKYYDMWGVMPEGASASHPWAGISRFKRGFGGVNFHYIGTFDFPYKPWLYRLYCLIQRLRGRSR